MTLDAGHVGRTNPIDSNSNRIRMDLVEAAAAALPLSVEALPQVQVGGQRPDQLVT